MSPNQTTSQTRDAKNLERENATRGTSDTVTDGSLRGMSGSLQEKQVVELLCQALETEIGGVQIYTTAIKCAQNEELREEWEKYLEETENHERVLREVFGKLELDPEMETPGRKIVRANGEALVQAMETALSDGEPEAAQLVAAECVVLGETKDHLNWELIGEVAKKFTGDAKVALQEAYDEIEEQEDEHLYHTRGWARELWLDSLGLPAVLPPPEEQMDVKSETSAARAKHARTEMLGGSRSKSTKSKKEAANGSRNKGSRGRGRSR